MLPRKKKLEQCPFLTRNHGLTALENINFSTFWTSSFYCLERRFFVLEYHKRHFPGLYCLEKKLEKIAIFEPKPWKNVNFSTFSTSCFYSLDKRFSVLEYHKRHFPGLHCLKTKSWKNCHFWTKTMKKCQFFDFFDFLFL